MRKLLFKISSALMLGAAVMTASEGMAQNNVSIETYAAPDGTECFLAPFQAAQDGEAAPVDAAVLVDVSASQIGADIRQRGVEAVRSFAANLPAGSRIQIFTSDNETESLTGGFVAPDSEEVSAALDTLADNTPLGAMDMVGALQTAEDSFAEADSENGRSILFIGRGVSSSSYFGASEAADQIQDLVDNRITFSAFANGAVTNNNGLGALAYHTGGVMVDPNVSDGSEAGKILADSEKASIYWPIDSIKSAFSEDSTIYPAQVPPIRSDRETFLIGSGNASSEDNAVSITAARADGSVVTLDWNLQTQKPKEDNQYLYQLVQNASSDEGLSLPIADRTLLREYQGAITHQNEMTFDMAQDALDSGDENGAKILAEQVGKNTPSDPRVADFMKKISLNSDDAFQKAEAVLDAQKGGSANILDASDSNIRLLTAKTKGEIKVAIEEARKLSKTNPEIAIQNIKLAMASVESDPYLSDGDREELLANLEANARLLEREKFAKEKSDLTAMRNKAKLDSIKAAVNKQAENQKRVEEIMKRFNSLMAEQQYTLAADVATAAVDLIDDLALPTQAANIARLTDAQTENQFLRKYRRIRFLDVLMSVERSHIPTSDEPPILYPDAETWLSLSKARKEKYANSSLFTQSETQEKIVKALDKVINMEVPDPEEGRPLTEWIDQMKKELGINIVFDAKNLEDSETSLDEMTINDNLLSVTFRTALNLVLRKYDLEYCVSDEYLYITTKDAIESLEKSDDLWRQIYHLRYYPISDLTLQPSSGNSGNSMGGGMMGGMGGMMGGMGGGMMGGMGGMGGGWNVPAQMDKRPSEKAAQKETLSAQKVPGTLATVSENLNEKWDNYFLANAPKKPAPSLEGTPEERDAADQEKSKAYEKELYDFGMTFMTKVNDLVKEKNYAEAVAALKSAIRNDMAAGWMYEALALALIQEGAPQKEIEKVVLSAAEFADDAVTLLGVAGYLETIGSDAKALQLYREISKADPIRPEPYVRGLALAQEVGDEEAQKWVTLGIAAGAWEGQLEKDVWEAGQELARKVLDKMVAEGREADAAEYEKALNEALVRDVIIEVKWTGDAEIDLAVQEPIQTVCWFAQPRTSAGGILRTVAVDNVTPENAKEGERSKVYVCPMAFSGEYNVCVSRTWGELPQNKVVVNIITNVGTENEKFATYNLDLTEKKAGFSVNLENGRRQNEVKEEVLTAAALVNQMQTKSNREITEKVRDYQNSKAKAQARRMGENQNYTASYEESGQTSQDSNNEFAAPEIRYTLGADSGYMPIINQYSVGASMQPNLGVTPDRRYILISPNTQFSGLVRMFQYNTASGSSGSSYGGSGGGGMSGGYGGGGMSGGMGGMSGGMGGMSGGMMGGMSGGMGGMSGGMGGGW